MPVPAELLPDSPTAAAASATASTIDDSLYAIVTNWRYVVVDLLGMGINLHSPKVRAEPWPGVRQAIFSLLEPDSPSRLRRALTRR